ncbi:MAG: hypothetical protein IJM46_06675, partial [Oscillospiraceae bacterium]|nr:hypothetical protein [Oscillospiraceae bacterium]
SSSLCRMFPWLVRLGSWIVLISSFSVSTLIFPILPLLLQKVNAVAVARMRGMKTGMRNCGYPHHRLGAVSHF